MLFRADLEAAGLLRSDRCHSAACEPPTQGVTGDDNKHARSR